MTRPISIVGAPSSIGIRPYDTGEARHLDLAPGTLRQLKIVERLGATDLDQDRACGERLVRLLEKLTVGA